MTARRNPAPPQSRQPHPAILRLAELLAIIDYAESKSRALRDSLPDPGEPGLAGQQHDANPAAAGSRKAR